MTPFLIGGNNKDGQWEVYLIISESEDEALRSYADWVGFGDMEPNDVRDVAQIIKLSDYDLTSSGVYSMFCFGEARVT